MSNIMDYNKNNQYIFNTTTLTVDNITEHLNTLVELLKTHSTIEINLSGIKHIDSAGVAFLLELNTIAKQKSCSIKFIEIPNTVEHLCQLYNIQL